MWAHPPFLEFVRWGRRIPDPAYSPSVRMLQPPANMHRGNTLSAARRRFQAKLRAKANEARQRGYFFRADDGTAIKAEGASEVVQAMAPKSKARFLPTKQAGAIIVEGVDVRDDAFLRTWAWRHLRYRVIRDGKQRCECCGARPSDGIVLHVDHIMPRRKRPDLALDPDNLQVLCADCNAGKGNWDQTRWTTKAAT